MTKTLRDQIWDAALEQLVAAGKFKTVHILGSCDLDEEQRQTVRRTLNAMEAMGWLERTSSQSGIWRVGWKGRMLLNISEDRLAQAKR